MADVPWHYNALCETCRYESQCKQRTVQEQTVSLVPNLSIEQARFLREVIQLRGQGGETDIEELDSLVNEGILRIEQEYPTTATKFRTMMGMKRGTVGDSPVLSAVKSKRAQVFPTLSLRLRIDLGNAYI